MIDGVLKKVKVIKTRKKKVRRKAKEGDQSPGEESGDSGDRKKKTMVDSKKKGTGKKRAKGKNDVDGDGSAEEDNEYGIEKSGKKKQSEMKGANKISDIDEASDISEVEDISGRDSFQELFENIEKIGEEDIELFKDKFATVKALVKLRKLMGEGKNITDKQRKEFMEMAQGMGDMIHLIKGKPGQKKRKKTKKRVTQQISGEEVPSDDDQPEGEMDKEV